MSDIDPRDLGPKVFKYDQIVTIEDIEHMIIYYGKAEELLRYDGDHEKADHICTAHKTMEALAQWVRDGKPQLIQELPDEPN